MIAVTIGVVSPGSKRVYDKQLACFVCGKLLRYRIQDHLKKKHFEVKSVKKAFGKVGRQRKKALEKLKNKGNFIHNIKVLSNGHGELIVARRPNKTTAANEFFPCSHCLGFFKKDDLWRHVGKCPHNRSHSESKDIQALVKSKCLLESALCVNGENDKALQELRTVVLQKMHKDEIYAFVENDTLILHFGKIMLRKLGPRRKNDVAQRMRQLARLVLEINDNESEPRNSISEFINGDGFDKIVHGVELLAGFSKSKENISVFAIPSLAIRLGHCLNKIAQMKRGIALRETDDKSLKDAENFLKLMESDWTDNVSSIALASLRTNKFNKPPMLPVTEDLIKIRDYQQDRISYLVQKLTKKTPTYHRWKELAAVTLSRVIMFNKRRGGEAAKLLIDTYKSRPDWSKVSSQEVQDTLSNAEKVLMKR